MSRRKTRHAPHQPPIGSEMPIDMVAEVPLAGLFFAGHTTLDGGRKQLGADILTLTPGDEWEVVGTLPMPLSSPAAAIIGGKLYVADGSPTRRSEQGNMWVWDAPLSPERERK